MLSLHEKISKVCPIHGLSFDPDLDKIRIDYHETATQDQCIAARALAEDWTPEDAKWERVRPVRNQLLTQADVLSIRSIEDGDMVMLEKIKQYKTLLRGLPESGQSPDEVIWPEAPKYGSTSS